MPFPIETQRFFLREMVPSDYPALCKIMQDDTVMYAYEGAFDDRETKAWLNEQFTRYEQLGFGLVGSDFEKNRRNDRPMWANAAKLEE